MSKRLNELRKVYVVGIGLHRYQRLTETSYVALGLEAIRAALADSGLPWSSVESSYIATARLGMAAGRELLCHLGATGIPLVHLENASASGSAAVRQGCIEIAGGFSDIVLAVGVDKPLSSSKNVETPIAYTKAGIATLAEDAVLPYTRYAILANEYVQKYGVSEIDIANVAVKNHRNGSRNPFAHRQDVRTIDEVLSGKRVAGSFTTLQCCPVGEGAAAVILASEDGMRRMGLDLERAVLVASTAASSEMISPQGPGGDASLTEFTTRTAMRDAQVQAKDLDVIELHDAFSIEEFQYLEAMGVSSPGCAFLELRDGAFDIGGRCAVSPSGGLIAMGHPLGPTGIGQIVEITRQLRGEGGERQQPMARVGLAHMVGLGAVCYAHVLRAPS